MKRLNHIISKEQVEEFLKELGLELEQLNRCEAVRVFKTENNTRNIGCTPEYAIVHALHQILQDK